MSSSSINSKTVRLISFVPVFIAVITLPWWLSTTILICLTFYFPFYIEVLFFGFLFDTLYSIRYSFPYTALSVATLFLLVMMFVGERIRK